MSDEAMSEEALSEEALSEEALIDVEAKDRLLLTLLPGVPFDGWTESAVKDAARREGMSDEDLRALFPGGARDALRWFSTWADRRMLEELDAQDLSALKVRGRIAAAVTARLRALEPHREAVRRALATLAAPQNAALGLTLVYRTVDAAWYAAGDTATDFNFYTKRALLGAVLAATTLYWLDDRSEGAADTLGFLDRRLANVMSLPKVGGRAKSMLNRLPNPFRLARTLR